MKTITYKISAVILLNFGLFSQAQILKNLGNRAVKAAERTVERRVERETEKKTDDAIDTAIGKKSKNKSKNSDSNSGSGNSENSGNSSTKKNTKANRNSDFEAGSKVLFLENFAQDRNDDLPANWNTNASAKVTTISGSQTKWMEFTSPGVFLWDSVKSLPENFTVEFDLFAPSTFSYYDAPLWLVIGNMKNKKELVIWETYKEKRGKEKRNGALIMLHPQDAGGPKKGYSKYEIWENGEKVSYNEKQALDAFSVNNNQIKVQVWKQKQRLRVYMDGEKIWDLPQAFEDGQPLNTILFSRYEAKEGNFFYISNLHIASSEDDLRSKILKDGKFSTNAILFATNSAAIKSESGSIIKEIAEVLKSTPTLKLKIVGHTDNSGKKEANLQLSKKRAESVKAELVSQYGIESVRLQTDGKGDAEPVSSNETTSGKSENRRVEFIKIN